MPRSTVVALALAGLVFGPASAQDVPTPVPRPKVIAPAAAAVPAAATKPAAAPQAATRPVAETRGNVFLLRGLMNVFSLGMDTLARKLRAKDIPVRVINYTRWRDIAPGLVEEYRTNKSVVPVVIIGHSLGADGAVNMANFLAENGVPVRLVVAFDGVHDGHTVARGVEEVVNYYKADGWGQLVEAAPGFKGRLQNIDLSDREEIDHLNIEKSTALHDEVIAKLSAIFAAARD
ncbi:MAG TPA: hypothetical protein VFK86_19505 [Bauldia sp.]|nr:hypothetical protein [Bauldia sp.]